jgi:hypothetical protein
VSTAPPASARLAHENTVLADDSLDELAQMDGWSVDGEVARFRPIHAGWSAMVMYRMV